MSKIRNLQFINRSSKSASADLLIAEEAIPDVMKWYGAYCAGDKYTVKVDDDVVRKDRNGEIIGKVKPTEDRWITS